VTFQLETLGALRLVAADGRVVQAQRRRLAILALLAAAGARGVTRDRLVGDLWPETSDERARHALNQLLYGIRQTVGDDALRGIDPVALDPSIVDSDVHRFERALAEGNLAQAASHYRGPFLDGFYLPDASEFERRVEEIRVRLAAAHVATLEQLATQAEHRGDAAEGVARRQSLAELDRLDARRAAALMRARVKAGDSAGALAYARMYEALVREELDVPVDPAVGALANEIREAVAARAAGAPPRSPVPEDAASAERASGGEPNTTRAPDGPVVVAGAASPGRAHRVLAYGVAALALIGVSFGVRQATSGRSASAAPTAPSPPSIAVLPLRNLGSDPADASVADGMTEALTAVLSRGGDLRVIPSSWVLALQERRMNVRQIAETLEVAYVLEGGVQKEGSRLRMQLRLVDSRDGSTRWSETYDRQMDDVFAVQDDIARSVTRELGIRLAAGASPPPRGRRHTPSIRAYEWYLRSMDPTLTRTRAGRSRIIAYLDSAVAADSSFADAYAGLAGWYLNQAGDAPGDAPQVFARAAQAARRAVALDDSSAAAHAALGWTRQNARDWSGAEASLKRAIALDPNVRRGHEGLARLYLWTGRRAEQLAEARLGVEVDPFSHSAVRELALALAMNGRCDEALELLAPLKTLTPPARVAGVIRGQCFAAKGMWPEAIAELQWAGEDGEARASLALYGYALARGGHVAEAGQILSDLISGRKYSHGAFGIATVYAGLEKYDEALAWFAKAADEGSVRVYLMGPLFEEVRRDPRFAEVKRHMKL
jgi:TolB-like protein/DNA-binding SARP family transcriptional activator/tetratricopeptide (TPR) repeat protein